MANRLFASLIFFIFSSAAADIPVTPTTENEIPDAITGNAGPLQGQDLAYYEADPDTRGYLAVPDTETTNGAVILIHEWNGLVNRIREVADAFAAEGYVALAADLYSGRTGSNREENMALVRETLNDMDTVVENLDAAAAYLRSRDDVNGKVAAIGWCYGGGVALSYALGGKHHEGTAIFYGRLLTDPDQLKSIDHEILGTFAEKDTSIPPEQVNEFVEALRKAGVPNDVHVYDDVEHGFWLHVDRDPDTNSKPALDAWQRLKAYLKRVL